MLQTARLVIDMYVCVPAVWGKHAGTRKQPRFTGTDQHHSKLCRKIDTIFSHQCAIVLCIYKNLVYLIRRRSEVPITVKIPLGAEIA